MTKRISPAAMALGLILGVVQTQSAFADSTGCGLGTTLLEGQTGIAPQIIAVTTNGTSGNQTFGITSGTLGCDSNDVIASAEVQQLAVANLDKLAADIARGEGETLASLASAMEIETQDQPILFTVLKDNFSIIFPSDTTTAGDVLNVIRQVMAKDESLAHYVDA